MKEKNRVEHLENLLNIVYSNLESISAAVAEIIRFAEKETAKKTPGNDEGLPVDDYGEISWERLLVEVLSASKESLPIKNLANRITSLYPAAIPIHVIDIKAYIKRRIKKAEALGAVALTRKDMELHVALPDQTK